MGWASWNNYHVGIDEDIIKAQADAMATNGMKECGYEFVNTDDGFFGGRDKQGRLLVHPKRFPHGMKALADYVHSKGLNAGIYSDAGYNTCGCHGDNDTTSVGCGLMGHEWADLWKYCQPGHYNDMDMLLVGRGMTYEEDKAHFSMWCMMCIPLLAGNDLTTMSKETLDTLTNKEVIALNQDPFFYQARRLQKDGDLEVWAKPLIDTMSGEVAVTLSNRSAEPSDITFDIDRIGLVAANGYTMRDLWAKKDYKRTTTTSQTFKVPAHGVVVLRLSGTSKRYNVYGYK